jgi:hypothetical protein
VQAARGDLPARSGGCPASSRACRCRSTSSRSARTELAAGRRADARRDLALVRAEQRLLATNGVNTDVDLALFEADHGSPARAVTLARRAWAQAPSVRSADALGWALTAPATRATACAGPAARCGSHSRDAMFLYHAGMTARAAGDRDAARAWLQRARSRRTRASRRSTRRGPRARCEGSGDEAPRDRRRTAPSRCSRRAGAAAAHPLGNFSVNHLDVVSIARDRVRRALRPRPGRDPDVPRARPAAAQVLARKRAEVAARRDAARRRPPGRAAPRARRRLVAPARPGRPAHHARRARPRRARATARGRRRPRRDVPRPRRLARRRRRAGRGTAVRSNVPAEDPTGGLRRYPQRLLESPADVRAARFAVAAGAGTVSAPRAPGAAGATTRNRSGDGSPASSRAPRRARRPARPAAQRVRWGRSTRSRPATARRWSPRTSSARAARARTPSRSGSPSRSRTRSASSRSAS